MSGDPKPRRPDDARCRHCGRRIYEGTNPAQQHSWYHSETGWTTCGGNNNGPKAEPVDQSSPPSDERSVEALVADVVNRWNQNHAWNIAVGVLAALRDNGYEVVRSSEIDWLHDDLDMITERLAGAAEERERLLRIVREGIEDINRDVGLTAEAERSMASWVGALRWVERQIEGAADAE